MTEEGENMDDVEMTAAPPEVETQDPSAQPVQGGFHVRGVQVYTSAQLPYAGTFLSAVILLVALVTPDYLNTHKYYEYGIAIAAVAMFFSLLGWIMSRGMENSQLLKYNNYFLFVWNFVGSCFMTFGGPFKGTGNGYFASWGITFFAIMGLGVSTDQVKQGARNMGPMMAVFATSVITFVAICSEGFSYFKGELIYTIIVAALSILMSAYVVRTEPTLLTFPLLAFFAVLWIIAASLVTFRGPFQFTGNGYFASWGGAISSVYATFAAREGSQGEVQEASPEDI